MRGLRQWLIDTYNGLYVIVLKPHMPTWVAVLAVVAAMLFGLLWGYGVAPTVFYDGSPYQMNEAARDQWIQMVAASYQAGFYTDDDIRRLLNEVEAPALAIERMISQTQGRVQEALINLRPLVVDASGTAIIIGRPAPRAGGLLGDLVNVALAALLTIVLALIISPVWRLLIKPNLVAPVIDRLRPKTAQEVEERKRQQGELALIRETRKREEAMRAESKKEAVGNPLGTPVIQKLSIYTKGRQYDDSFAIEDQDNTFYGECGATIAKTLNGSLAAVDVWLFDKEDFVRTLNKVLVTEGAASDPATRAEIEERVENPATDIAILAPGQMIHLETDLILMRARVVDAQFTSGTNVTLDGLTLQIEVWYKPMAQTAAAVPVAVPAAVPASAVAMPPPVTQPSMPPATPVSTYTPPIPPPPGQQAQAPTYTPPMPTPTNFVPQQPPPPPPPPKSAYDDDPFGGTGDFEPVNP